MVDGHKITDVLGMGYGRDLVYNNLEELFHKRLETPGHLLADDMASEADGLKELFAKFNITAAFPIRVEANEVAILVLGNKLSGETYTNHDLQLLDIFSS